MMSMKNMILKILNKFQIFILFLISLIVIVFSESYFNEMNFKDTFLDMGRFYLEKFSIHKNEVEIPTLNDNEEKKL